jgi:TatD DNase family protein
VKLYDAHNHLQDPRLDAVREEVFREMEMLDITCACNATSERDWESVARLAGNPRVIPFFGLHPWFLKERGANWENDLMARLRSVPSGVGEIGLDRWMENADPADQETVFVCQWEIAVELDRPIAVHCLKAWGRLFELIRQLPPAPRGFLLHSYGGPAEMVPGFAKLGAYFSLSGYFAHPRKEKQSVVFREVPQERLLLETDAPDMLPPEKYRPYRVSAATEDKEANHPANLKAVYEFAATFLGVPLEELAGRTAENFQRWCGGIEKSGKIF